MLNWSKIFDFNSDITISQAIDIFYEKYTIILNTLQGDLSNFYREQQKYIFPNSNLKLAKDIKLLVMFGFFIIYQITNEEKIFSIIKQFENNNKFATPDVFFYILSLINEVTIKINETKWIPQFVELIKTSEVIGQDYANVLDVDLNQMYELKIDINEFVVEKNNDKSE